MRLSAALSRWRWFRMLRWALVRRSRDPEADLRDRIACGYAVGDLGDPRFERRVGPHGEYLLPKEDPAWAIYKDKPWTTKTKNLAAMISMIEKAFDELHARDGIHRKLAGVANDLPHESW